MLTILSIGSTFSITTYATENNNEEDIQRLIEAGYTQETAEALDEETIAEIIDTLDDNPDLVDISTSSMEVDFLGEVEALCSYTDEELIEQGAKKDAIEESREEIEDMYNMSKKELKKSMEWIMLK